MQIYPIKIQRFYPVHYNAPSPTNHVHFITYIRDLRNTKQFTTIPYIKSQAFDRFLIRNARLRVNNQCNEMYLHKAICSTTITIIGGIIIQTQR